MGMIGRWKMKISILLSSLASSLFTLASLSELIWKYTLQIAFQPHINFKNRSSIGPFALKIDKVNFKSLILIKMFV